MKKFCILMIVFLCANIQNIYAQMPPHPSLLEKIKNGEISTPYAISNINLVRSKGIDEPWATPRLKLQKNQNVFSKSFGPAAIPTGSWKALVILVQFTDKPSQVNADYFDDLLFGQNTGTLRDYYNKVSYGNLDIVTLNLPSAVGWITAPQPYSYYVNENNGMGSYPQNSQKLVEDIVNLVDPQIDFSPYDNDGDGYVDGLFIVHTGSGADYTGNNNDMWSHTWTTHTTPVIDGVKISRYSIEPEFWQNPGDMTCGVFAHEMGHSVFGLPDLYDTDYSSYGLGKWSLMATGSWNGTLGNSPAFPDAWSHIQMGYLTPSIVSANISGQLINNVENIPETYLLQTSICGTEYFLVENRQPVDYDTYLPGNGLLIYHVDNSVSNNNNEWYPGHTSSGHYHVALEQSTGRWSLEHNYDRGSMDDPYPGLTDSKIFGGFTIPDSKTYNFNVTGIEVSNISSSSLTMSADFKLNSLDTLPQFKEQTSISLTGVRYSSVAWGDYDNDGYLDLLITGDKTIFGHASPVTKIYHNNGDNIFSEQTSISLTGVYDGSVAWGDYDNDGYLDILLTGKSSYDGNSISKIYHNNGNNTFSEQTSINLSGISRGSAAWGDYDNDGDLDILLTESIWGSKIYRNNGDNTFTEQTSILLTGVGSCSAAWGDYDNDGNLDILLSGAALDNIVSKIYHNNGDNTFTEQTSISLTGVWISSVAWGDYDNDGLLDILLTGSSSPRGDEPVSKIYRNNGDNTFTEQTSISLAGVRVSSAAWGDYDNDGYLDIFLIGFTDSSIRISKIYHNNKDNTFTEQDKAFIKPPLYYASAAWGDYDNDGSLDIISAGIDGNNNVSKIHRNYNVIQNTPPSVPTNLKTLVNENDVIFSWDKSTDNKTPQNGLTYNLSIGTSPGDCDILSPMSDLNTGKRRIVGMGNAGHCNSKTIKGLADGKYYWSVQAIDNNFTGSGFAETRSFTLPFQETITITYPKGGEIFKVGSNPTITYTSEGTSGYLNFDYSTDGGVTWDTIATNRLDDGEFKGWIVPNTPSTNCKIRISDMDGESAAISDSLFTIQMPQFTKQTSISLEGKEPSWGDYDNDGDLDILLIGQNGPLNNVIKIYQNNGDDTFTEQDSISLSNVNIDKAVWADYDNDGYIDIFLTSHNDIKRVSIIYRNNKGNSFTAISIPIIGDSFDLGDYDNDGDLDIASTGIYGLRTKSLYRNNGNDTFTEDTSFSIIDVGNASATWGDYDNDGDLDIIFTGLASGNEVSKIYRNNGDNTFTEQTSIILPGIAFGSATWGDYDSDGDLDILLTGSNFGLDYSLMCSNNGDNSFTVRSIHSEGAKSSICGDYDADGDLDILTVGGGIFIYRNNGDNTFTDIFYLGGSCFLPWGDYDNDGDLDLLFNDGIYRNNNIISNTRPSVPSGLKAAVNGSNVTFSWDKSTDNETPQNGLTYNLAIGTNPGACDIMSPMADLNNGKRRIVGMGNVSLCNSWTIKGLPDGVYYWSVQAIDNNFEGSRFAATESFVVQSPGTIIITYPKGGESFEAGSNPIITYSSLGNSGYINLDYSIDGGINWDTITTNQPDDGEYKGWIVPNTPSKNCKIRISDVDGDPVAISDSLFTITGVVPVELVTFTTDLKENEIIVNWKTATETNNKGFEIERKLNSGWEKIGYIDGHGTTTIPTEYNYTDNFKYQSYRGIASYRLKQIDLDGSYHYTEEIKINIDFTPKEFILYQNYPNPFNPNTVIKYALPYESSVDIIIYNMIGQRVEEFKEGIKEAGYHNVNWHPGNLSSGVYFYSIVAKSTDGKNNYSKTLKMLYMK